MAVGDVNDRYIRRGYFKNITFIQRLCENISLTTDF